MLNLKLFIISVILIPQLTFASSARALKSLVDEYTYQINVEWDQNDKEFAKSKQLEFQSNLGALIQTGISEDEIANAFPSINTKELNNQLTTVNLSNPEELASFIRRNQDQLYPQGASWNGEAFVGIAGGVLLLALIAVLVVTNNRSIQCPAGEVSAYDENNGGWYCFTQTP